MLILSKDNPKDSLYYLGANLISFMSNYGKEKAHLSTLYQDFNEYNPIPFNRFMLVLDWLFMVGLVTGNDKGEIQYVSKRADS